MDSVHAVIASHTHILGQCTLLLLELFFRSFLSHEEEFSLCLSTCVLPLVSGCSGGQHVQCVSQPVKLMLVFFDHT